MDIDEIRELIASKPPGQFVTALPPVPIGALHLVLLAEIDRLRTELGQYHAQRDRAAAETRRASGAGR